MLEVFVHLHAMVIHFPIALFILAATIEVYRCVRLWLKPNSYVVLQPTETTELLLVVGTVFASLAASLGWFAALSYASTDTLMFHRWFGTTTAVWAITTIAIIAIVRSYKKKVFAIVTLAVLTSVTAHFGGTLVYGSLF